MAINQNELKLNKSGALLEFLNNYSLYLIFLVLLIVSGMLSPVFFQTTNIMNLLRQASFIGIISLGMTFVILTGGIDLSVGSIFAFSGVFLAFLFHYGMYSGYVATLSPMLPSPVIVVITLAAGALIGLVNGGIIAKIKVAPFVVTMGTMVAARGLAYSLAGGRTIFGIGEDLSFLGMGFVGPVPVPVVIWAALFAVCWFILKYTRFGRAVYALGGDEESARLAGIRVDYYKIMVYVIAGLLTAIAAIMMAARIDQGEPRMGEYYETDAIAAVVIGGTSMFGGVGTVQGTVVGCLILASITNILNLVGVHPFTQQIVKGVIIIAGILLQNLVQRKQLAGAKA